MSTPTPLTPNVPKIMTMVSVSENKVRLHTRIVVLGPSKVGKTAIVKQFLYGDFPVTHEATVDELYRTQYKISHLGVLSLDILDTSGSYEFPAMRRLAIETADAFLLVFDLSDYSSFEAVASLRQLILNTKGKHSLGEETQPPIVVVGNKCDEETKRQVPLEMAESVSTIDWETGYVECSAKEDINVCQVFQELMVQGKVPLDIRSAIGKESQRRRSLPAYPTSPKIKSTNVGLKRHSCSLS